MIPLVAETLLLAPEGMVTVTALKWTGVFPTVGNLAEATTVRPVAGAAGGVCPAAAVASATVQTKNVPIGVDRMWLSLNQFNGSNQTAVAATSAKPPIARSDPSLDHLVRAQQQRLRDREPECL